MNSPGAPPRHASTKAAVSRTVRVWQPWMETRPVRSDALGAIENTPREGLSPMLPLKPAGMRMEPPPSVACEMGSTPAATAAAVAAGVLPISHATDGGGSIRIPAGFNGNIGLKPSRGVFSIAPKASDLTGLVSIQGCHTRTVRDTAAFVDACRGGAPGEFMPYWLSLIHI